MENDVVIKLEHVTKDYKRGRGIFDISFEIKKGSVFGYCGTNGAGKTTTLRTIMGFIRPDSGTVLVKGLDAWKFATDLKNDIAYLPGEIGFPDLNSGTDFLHFQSTLAGTKSLEKAEKIINALQLDPTANVKRMSKGMKQKTAIVCAFMDDKEIIILDEPTTGLDPLMRAAFLRALEAEKARGATIIMSSHMFDELEDCCDYVGLLNDGHLVDVVDMHKLQNQDNSTYKIQFTNADNFNKFMSIKDSNINLLNNDASKNEIVVNIKKTYCKEFIHLLTTFNIKEMNEIKYTLKEYFMTKMKNNTQEAKGE